MFTKTKEAFKKAAKSSKNYFTLPPSSRYIVEENRNNTGKKFYRVRKNRGNPINQVNKKKKFNVDPLPYNLNPFGVDQKHFKKVAPMEIKAERITRSAKAAASATGTQLVKLALAPGQLVNATVGQATRKIVVEPGMGFAKALNPSKSLGRLTGSFEPKLRKTKGGSKTKKRKLYRYH